MFRRSKKRAKPARCCIAPGTLDDIRRAMGKPTRGTGDKPPDRPPGRDSEGENGLFRDAARGR